MPSEVLVIYIMDFLQLILVPSPLNICRTPWRFEARNTDLISLALHSNNVCKDRESSSDLDPVWSLAPVTWICYQSEGSCGKECLSHSPELLSRMRGMCWGNNSVRANWKSTNLVKGCSKTTQKHLTEVKVAKRRRKLEFLSWLHRMRKNRSRLRTEAEF